MCVRRMPLAPWPYFLLVLRGGPRFYAVAYQDSPLFVNFDVEQNSEFKGWTIFDIASWSVKYQISLAVHELFHFLVFLVIHNY